MKISTLKKLVFEKNIFSFLKLGSRMSVLYSVSFAVAANRFGVLASLNQRAKTFGELADDCFVPPERLDAFKVWLNCGVKAGELKFKNDRYVIRGKLSRHLVRETSVTAAAMFEEVARYHFDAILNAPSKIITGNTYSLQDQDPEVIAKSSRILEPFVEEAIDWAFQIGNFSRVLEVGFGSGIYVKYMKERWPELDVVAIDYQQEVVDIAKDEFSNVPWASKVDFKFGDITRFADAEKFDLITLHNNLYYIPTLQRQALFENLNRLCKPGGKVILTSSFKGGTTAIAALDLWFSLSDLDTGLPQLEDMNTLAEKGGFGQVEVKSLMPGDTYYAVSLTKVRELPKEKLSIVKESRLAAGAI